MRTRKTPCVGICSTTYGDLVCRGCKRFAHEITQWNGYQDTQREQVWTRLEELRNQVVEQTLAVADAARFREYAQALPASEEVSDSYRVLGHLVAASESLAHAGLVAPDCPDGDALKVMQMIDAEIYRRSVAHYERYFRVTG